MALPINIEQLIHGTIVETDRIEFKKGWNPEDILHTMCAFANDYNNLGGGYIIVGIEEENGKPVLPPSGLADTKLDSYIKDLNRLSNLIQSRYFGIHSVDEFQSKTILTIWCPGGDNRPFKAPIS